MLSDVLSSRRPLLVALAAILYFAGVATTRYSPKEVRVARDGVRSPQNRLGSFKVGASDGTDFATPKAGRLRRFEPLPDLAQNDPETVSARRVASRINLGRQMHWIMRG
jgi:hypothetical protein